MQNKNVCCVVAVCLSAAAMGQCPQIVSGYARPGVNNFVKAMTAWDPGSTGFPQMVIGGAFTKAAGVTSGGVALWDGTALNALKNSSKTGIDGTVNGLTVFNNEIIAVGTFTTINTTTPCNRVAKWNGTDWVVMGSGVNSDANCVAVHNGELYVGGEFSSSGATAASRIAKWDGAGFVPLTSGVVGSVYSIQSWNGKMYVGGVFGTAGGLACANIAAWDGANWSAPPSGVGGAVYVLSGAFDGLYVGGAFNSAGGNATIKYVAKYTNPSGTHVWATPGGNPNAPVHALVKYGDLFIGGEFTMVGQSGAGTGGIAANHLARFNGTNWAIVNSGTTEMVGAMASGAGEVFVAQATGGGTSPLGGKVVSYVGRCSTVGGTVSTLGAGPWKDGVNASGNASAVYNGNLYLEGDFTHMNGSACSNLLKVNAAGTLSDANATFTGQLNTSVASAVYQMRVINSELVCVGNYQIINGVASVGGIAAYNGITWHGFGAGANEIIYSATLHGTRLIAVGRFTHIGTANANKVAQWDGSTWTAIGANSTISGNLYDVASYGGNLYVGGLFTQIGGVTMNNVAKWNGTAWSSLGTGVTATFPQVNCLLPVGGNLIVSGAFDNAGGVAVSNIASWNGTSFSALGTGVAGLQTALGTFRGQIISGNLAGIADKWNGTNWTRQVFAYTDRTPTLLSSAGILSISEFQDKLVTTGNVALASPSGPLVLTAGLAIRDDRPPVIGTHPLGGVKCYGSDIVMSVSATGAGPLQYQWKRNGVALVDGDVAYMGYVEGSNLPQFVISSARGNCGGLYTCEVSNGCNTVVSNPALVTFHSTDFNCDLVCDFFDYLDFVNEFGSMGELADFNWDGVVDFFDYLDFVDAFSMGC